MVKSSPSTDIPAATSTRLPPTTERLRNNLSGSSGIRVRASTITNTISSTRPATTQPEVPRRSQPSSGTRLVPYTISPSATVTSIAPGTSSRTLPATGRAETSITGHRASITRPTGTFTRNTHGQPSACVTTPPSSSPPVAPIPPTADHAASDSAAGISSAADTPWPTRAEISTAGVGASPQTSEATTSSANPHTNTRRAPNPSANRPPSSSSAPPGNVHAVNVHWAPAGDSPRSAAIDGAAVKTLVELSTSTK